MECSLVLTDRVIETSKIRFGHRYLGQRTFQEFLFSDLGFELELLFQDEDKLKDFHVYLVSLADLNMEHYVSEVIRLR